MDPFPIRKHKPVLFHPNLLFVCHLLGEASEEDGDGNAPQTFSHSVIIFNLEKRRQKDTEGNPHQQQYCETPIAIYV